MINYCKFSCIIHRANTKVMLAAFGFLFAMNTSADNCASILQWGIYDEIDTRSQTIEERRLYKYVCEEQSNYSNERQTEAGSATYELFSASARKGKTNINDYYESYCHQSEDDLFGSAESNTRQRVINNNVILAWRACKEQAGKNVVLKTKILNNQTGLTFDIAYDSTREDAFLNGINSQIFKCMLGDNDISKTGINGEPIKLTATSTNIVCNRIGEEGTIQGMRFVDYPAGFISLDLSTGLYNMDFVYRKEGPAIDQFEELTLQVQNLADDLETVKNSQDYTAATINENRFFDRESVRQEVPGHQGYWGTLRSPFYCPTNHYVCGLRQRIESRQGDGDDTAMNGLNMYCCPLFPR